MPSLAEKEIKQEIDSDGEGIQTAPTMPTRGRATTAVRGTTRGGSRGAPRGGVRGGAKGGGPAKVTPSPPSGPGTPGRTPAASPAASTDISTAYSPSPPPQEIASRTRKRPRTANKQPIKPLCVGSETARRFITDDLGLLESGKFADAKIICIKKEWNVHRTILCTRSPWFANTFGQNTQDGQAKVLTLHSHTEEEIETLLRFMYSGSIDTEKFSLDKGSFVMYANLYNVGFTFKLEALQSDALSLLGQYCDKKLQLLCSYDMEKSGRTGVIGDESKPDEYILNLLEAIWKAYDNITTSTSLQALLATFVYAGRNRLLTHAGFHDLADRCPMFGNDIFKLILGKTISEYAPVEEAMHQVGTGIDHTHRSQHPDRCSHCHEVFDDKMNSRAMYNPFEMAVRPSTFCAECVIKNEESEAPLWRVPPRRRRSDSQK